MMQKSIAIVVAILFVVTLLWAFVARSTNGVDLETQTFELQYLDPQVAAEIVDPYVFYDRPNSPGRASVAQNLLTVRETRDNLERIGRLLVQYDTPPPSVRLHFQVIGANGNTRTDSDIADVESVLRRLFQFSGYRLLAQAMLGGVEGSGMEQRLASEGRGLNINAYINDVRSSGDSGVVHLEVQLSVSGVGNVLQTSVNVRSGQTIVLGSTQPEPQGETLILTVRPEIVVN
jgi:type II secretory pathway component GspD/PulD (secretin)